MSLTGCASSRTVKFEAISVGEEGSIKLQRITDNEDRVPDQQLFDEGGKKVYIPNRIFDLSEDGKKIAFIGTKNERANIFVKDLGSLKSSLQRTFRDDVLDLAYSNDDKNIAFTSYRDYRYGIFTVPALSGTAIRQIASQNNQEFRKNPVFSNDSKLIYFVQFQPEIAKFKFERKIKNDSVFYERPVLEYFEKGYLWSFDLTNGSLTQYTEGLAPSMSPDGSKMALTRINTESKRAEIWLVDLEKGQEFLLFSSKDENYYQPSFSPDGQRIAFVKLSNEVSISKKRELLGGVAFTSKELIYPPNFDVYIANIDGSSVSQITYHPGHDLQPMWAKDGKSLFFLSQRGSADKEWNIWKMELSSL